MIMNTIYYKCGFILLVSIFFMSCKKNTPTDELLDQCFALEDMERIDEADLDCIYNMVFLYKDNIYSVCECCVCDKWVMAYDCNSDMLCDFGENCMVDFFQKAEFLFYTTPDK